MPSAGSLDNSRRARRITVAAAVAVPVCLAAGGFELSKALAGNTLSWVYAFEWPLIAAYGVYVRNKLVKDLRREAAPASPAASAAPVAADDAPPAEDAAHPAGRDTELLAWQQYLARLNAVSPPGGPPPRGPVGR